MVYNNRLKGDRWFLSNVCINRFLICFACDYHRLVLFYFYSFQLLENDSYKINWIICKFKLLPVSTL